MRKFFVCLLTLLMLAVASMGYAEDRIDRSALSFIYGNSTLNKYYPFNASHPIYAPAGSWLELDIFTNSSTTLNNVIVEKFLDFGNGTIYSVGNAPGGWLYTNGNSSNQGFANNTVGPNRRWASVYPDNATGHGQGLAVYAAASSAATPPQMYFSPVGGWYRLRITDWSGGDYTPTNNANSTNGTLRVRKPKA